ncbi:PLxRFG domain-containing protein [Aminobacter sp. MDW-2]|uniref:PLxRFG domain-containing protein n=1 Tax=Aminobacter sp. MDW-2 TaxID=2666139 RepID=UPI0012B083E6|nr:PLxRFG domain-containing protein [Aminobacter sp. MDW-2]MRX32796.1 PLxRFG domain-containing protein [Aminobacter sp. MDW-2]QNH34542.1 PLxRFG domain-containing protein [Aminobacter sp. MDW-2]
MPPIVVGLGSDSEFKLNDPMGLYSGAPGLMQPAAKPADTASTTTPPAADRPTPTTETGADRLPAGMRNNNPGNIKFAQDVQWEGLVGPSENTDQGDPQAVFDSPEMGMRAAVKLARNKYDRGQKTANDLIAGDGGWTPGNTQAAANIAGMMGVSPDEDLQLDKPEQAQKFMRALVTQEHGGASSAYGDDMITGAVDRIASERSSERVAGNPDAKGLARLAPPEPVMPTGAGGNLHFVHKGQDKLNPEFQSILSDVSGLMGRDFTITSGYRAPTHPVEAAKAGGPGEHSRHSASDISMKGMNEEERMQLVSLLKDKGVKRFGIYKNTPDMLHVDMKDQTGDGSPWFMYDRTNKRLGKAPEWFQRMASGHEPERPAAKREDGRIVVAEDFKTVDPMGLYAGSDNPFSAAAAAPIEQQAAQVAPADTGDAAEAAWKELEAKEPGRYQIVDEGNLEQWQQQWQADQPGMVEDMARIGGGGVIKGAGHIVRGVGALANLVGGNWVEHVINPIFGTDFQPGNPLNVPADWIAKYGEGVQQGMSAATREAFEQSQPGGDLFSPSTWTLGENPSLVGYTALGLDVLGSMAPVLAAAVVAGPAGGALVGGLQGGGAADQSARDIVDAMAAEPGKLEKESAYYREQIAAGRTPEQALDATKEAAAKMAFIYTAPVSAFGGAATGKLVDPGTAVLAGKNIAARISGRAALSGLEEGAQEAAETIATRSGVNSGAGTDVSVTEGTFGDFVLGALGGGVPGAAAGAASKRADAPAPVDAGELNAAEPVPQPKKGPLANALEHGERQAAARVRFTINDPAVGDMGAGELHGQSAQMAPDQNGVPAGMRRVVLGDGSQRVIGEQLLAQQPQQAAPSTAASQKAAAIPEGAFEIGATVRVDAEGIDPFMGRIDGYDGNEAILFDAASGEVYQVPIGNLTQIADAPARSAPAAPSVITRGMRDRLGQLGYDNQAIREMGPETAANVIRSADNPVEIDPNDPALEPADATVERVNSELPPADQQKPILERFLGAPKPGNRIIVDAPGIERFAARIESYEEGATEALVVNDDGQALQVSLDHLFVSNQSKKQVEAEDLRRNPPVERDPVSLEGTARRVGKHTVDMPDDRHARLYDLGKARMESKRLLGTSQLDLDRAREPEQRALADQFGVTPEALGQMADDYRYRVERAGKEARSDLPVKMHAVNPKRLKQWQGERSKGDGGPANDLFAAAADGVVAMDAPPAASTTDEGPEWWDTTLDADARKAALAAAGVKRSEKTRWADFPANIRKKISDARIAAAASVVDTAAQNAATSPTNDRPEPTAAQKEAGNYAKGHARVGGLNVSIENPAGSERSGSDADGKPWSITMKSHYGYFKGTVGRDKDHIDTFIKPGVAAELGDDAPVFVVDQQQKSGRFDEHKVMLGFETVDEARNAYMENYTPGWTGLRDITPTTLGAFKGWLADGDTRAPFARRDGRVAPTVEPSSPEPTREQTLASAARAVIEVGGHGDRFAKLVRADATNGELLAAFGATAGAAVAGASFDRVMATARGKALHVTMPGTNGAALKPVVKGKALADAIRMAFSAPGATGEAAPPAVLYHGTDQDFDRFERSDDIGFHFGSAETARARLDQVGAAPRIVVGARVDIRKPLRLPDLGTWSPANVVAALKDAGVLDAAEATAAENEVIDREWAAKKLAAKGYDGIVYANSTEQGGDSYIALSPDQVNILERKREREQAPSPLPNATAPEHTQLGVDDRELGQIVKEFKDVQADMMQGDHPVSNIFQQPAKGDVVRLAKKAGVTERSTNGKRVYHRELGWMTPAEAKAKIANWKAHAQAQGKDPAIRGANSQKVVLSLFDLSGEWSKPWEEAGYQVFRFDIQDDPTVGDVNNFSTEFFGDWFGDFDGMDIYAVLAACPCTDFASSGALHFAAKDADGRTVASVKLVHQTLRVIEYFKPAVWALENPVGRIAELGGLPNWRLAFDPFHLGDTYTKKTLIWGRFNADLPIAPVEPTEGSKMHSQYGGKSLATKNARSETPEGFSYGFFMANNAHDHAAMAVSNKFDRLDKELIGRAIDAGVTPAQITTAVEDPYYIDLDDDAANDAIRGLLPANSKPGKVIEKAKGPRVAEKIDQLFAENKLFTADKVEAARARLKAKMNQANSGIDPEVLIDGMTIAGAYIEAGVRKFGDFAKHMVDDFGTGVRPYLLSFWEGARHYPGLDTTGMTSSEDSAREHAEGMAAGKDADKMNEGAVKRPVAAEASSDGREQVEQGVPEAGRAGLSRDGSGREPAAQQGATSADTGNVAARKPRDVGAPAEAEPDGQASFRFAAEDVGSAGRADALGDAGDGRPRDGGTRAPDARTRGDRQRKQRVAGARPGAGGEPADGGRAPASPPELTKAPDTVSPANAGPGDFVIDDPLRVVGGGQVARFNKNKAAIELRNELVDAGRKPTREEQEVLAGYTGWGSFGQELFQGSWDRSRPKEGWEARDQWLRDNLGKDEWEGMQRSIINAHYTDPPTVLAMWDMVRRMGFTGGRVLEPSIGIGNFFGMMPADMAARSHRAGIELDPVTGSMAQMLYPSASIQIKGFEQSQTPDGFYDLVIGNWPFADFSPADRRYNRLSPLLHDYFFLKAIDQVRPGGLVVGITTKGTMDKQAPAIRMEMAKKAELVAAFRLPTGAFEEYAGTKVVTDILILRKRAEPLGVVAKEGWITAKPHATRSGTDVVVNEYFHANPHHVIGEIDYGSGTTSFRPGLVVHRPADMMAELRRVVEMVPERAYSGGEQAKQLAYVANHTSDRTNSLTKTKDGLFVVQGEFLAPANDVMKYRLASADATAKREAQLSALVDMRKLYGSLIDAERAGDANSDRKALRKAYEAFKQDHGSLSESFGLTYLRKIDDPFYPALAALESRVETKGKVTFRPAAILTESTMRGVKRMENPSVADAFVLARNEAVSPTADRIAELAKVTVAEAKSSLIDAGAAFETPAGAFVPADSYLSGNVREKLRQARAALADGNQAMQRNVTALEAAVPADIPYYKIETQFGATWVTPAAYADYVAHMLGLDSSAAIKVAFQAGAWSIEFPSEFNHRPEANAGFGTTEVKFKRLVRAAIANQTINVKRKDSDGNEYVDRAATAEANGRIAEIRLKFAEWLWSDPERRTDLEREYNETRNSYATPKFDGSFLGFQGMALSLGRGPFNLREHQVNAIWRALVTRKSLNAHEVGTGKTFTMGGIAVESRRYGIAKKPMLFAHNANSKSVADEIQQMYPSAKVLYVDNLSKENIKVRMMQIANDDWDAVVLPHSLIDRIGFREETLMDMAQQDLADLEAAAREAAEEDGVEIKDAMLDDPEEAKKLRSVTAKQLVKQRFRIVETIKKLAQQSSRADSISFEDLGVDMVLVDEAHEFKKPPMATKMSMKGLQTQVSNRSVAMAFITRYTRAMNGGGNVHLFTGTPITNTMTEVFHMMRYMMLEEMESVSLADWDGWFGSFAREVEDVELSSTNEYETVVRLQAFINVPELRRMIGQYMDVVFADDMPEMQPRRINGKTLSDPSLTEAERAELLHGRTENAADRPYKRVVNMSADMSAEQTAVFERVQLLAKKWRNMGKKERKDAMAAGAPEVPIIHDQIAEKASFDVRLVNAIENAGLEGTREMEPHPSSKPARVVARLIDIYRSHPQANQVVFMEQGMAKSVTRSEGPAGEKRPVSYKAFSTLADMVERLVQAGIPRDQIATVTGATSKDKRKEIADAMNRGDIRIVFGSTDSLGVGVNMQRNLRAMHHMDAPWMPGELEQRNGRGHRQGNQWNTVDEYRYLTDRLDGRRWQVLAIKQRFITDFMKSKGDVRVIEGDAASDEQSDIISTFADAAGDPRVLLREKYKKKLEQLQSRERIHTQGKADASRQARRTSEGIADNEKRLAKLRDGGVVAKATALLDQQRGETFRATIFGKEFDTFADASAYLKEELPQQMRMGQNRAIGRYGGYVLNGGWDFKDPFVSLSIEGETFESRGPSLASLAGNIRKVLTAEQDLVSDIERDRGTVERMRVAAGEPFHLADQLTSVERQLADLEADIEANPVAPPYWLRSGAPVETPIQWKGKPFIVTGHRWTDDGWYVLADDDAGTVAIPYTEARDAQGMEVYEQRLFTAPKLATKSDGADGAREYSIASGARRQSGLPSKNFKVLSIFPADDAIKAHRDYKAAKGGDRSAAVRLVSDLIDGDAFDRFAAAFGSDVIFVAPHAVEASGKNAIPHAFAHFLAAATGAEADQRILQVNRAFHTGARPMDRLLGRPRFGGPVLRGRKYVLVDDVTVMGGTLAELSDHIIANGGEVVGAATLVNASRSGIRTAPKQHVRLMEERYGNTIREELHVEPAALTGDEALVVLGSRDADALRDRIAAARQDRERRLLQKGLRAPSPEGEESQLAPAGWSDVEGGASNGGLTDTDLSEITGIIRKVSGLTSVQWRKRIDLPNGAPGWGTNTPTTAAGYYSPAEDAITLALDSATPRSAYHEAFHRLQRFFLTEQERSVLNAEIGRLRRIVSMSSGREGQAADMSTKEVEAEAFAIYAGSDGKPAGGTPHRVLRAAWDRIAAAIRRVRNFIAGRGYQTAEDVFNRARRGETASRQPGRPRTLSKFGKEFQVAWHGTRHLFRRFSMDAINSGEGNQTFGWGLYFAGDKAVAETYQKAHATYGGFLYNVDIPDDGELLTWDALLRRQPKAQRAKLDALGIDYDQVATDMFDGKASDLTFRDVYQWMSGEQEGGFGSDKAASEALRGAGIPGHRYLDGDSRDAGAGTYNYVIYDESRVSVLDMSEAMPPEYLENSDGFDDEFEYSIAADRNDRTISPKRIVDELRGKLTDFKPSLLSAIPLNYFTDLARPNMDAVPEYLRVKRLMDAYRGKKHAAMDTVAQDWLKFVRLGKDKAKALADLMHDATLAGVDPSKTEGEHTRQPEYPGLRRRFQELAPAGRALFGKVRDAYKQQAAELDEILLDNVRKAQEIAQRRAEERYRKEVDRISSAPKLSKEARKDALDEAERAYKAERMRAQWSAKARMTKMRIAFESSRVEEPYFPLARFGRYFVTVRDIDGTVLSFTRREGAADRDRLAVEMRKAFPTAKVETGVMESSGELRNAMDPRMVAEIEELLGGANVDATVMDQIWQRYLESMPDLSARKRFIHRKGTAGFDADALRAFSSHMFHAAHQMGRLKYGLELQELSNKAADQAKNSDDTTAGMTLANELRRRHEWVMNPTGGKVAQTMTSAAFVWYLATSPASALLNMTQTPMMGIPILGARFGGVAKAATAMLKASRDSVVGRGSVARANLSNDEQAALEAFYESGLIDRTQSHDIAGVGETGVEYSPLRARVMAVMSWAFHRAEVWNREVTALAAYRMAREAGQNVTDAIDTAHDLTWKTHFDYANSSRPRLMQNDFAKVALVFRSHNINMLYRVGRDIQQSFKGESPQARKEARYQLAGVVGMQVLMSGVKGVIAFNLAMAVLGAIFGDDDDPMDFEMKFRAAALDILGPELGGVVLNGVPGHYLGVDLSSRIGMPDLWFRSPTRDLQGKEEFDYWVMNSLGASVSMLGDAWRGISLINDGQTARGVEVLTPKFARDLMKAYRYMDEGLVNLRGDQIMAPEHIDAWDVIAQASGFTPASVAETYDRNSALINAEARLNKRRQKLINAFALAAKLGDADGRRDAMDAIKRFNRDPLTKSMAIGADTLQRSLAVRERNARKREDGVLIENERLGRDLRAKLPEPIYR